MTTLLPRKHYSEHQKALEIDGDQRTPGEEFLEKKMKTARFKYSWTKMEVAAQDRVGWRQVVGDLYVPLGRKNHKSYHHL